MRQAEPLTGLAGIVISRMRRGVGNHTIDLLLRAAIKLKLLVATSSDVGGNLSLLPAPSDIRSSRREIPTPLHSSDRALSLPRPQGHCVSLWHKSRPARINFKL